MTTPIRKLAVCALALPFMVGCASKGFVRERLAAQRAALDSSIASERDARMAADIAMQTDLTGLTGQLDGVKTDVAQLRQDITQLRADLTQLKADFDVRITAMENGLQFAMPVTFGFNESGVAEDATPALDRFADVAKKYYGNSVVTVEGFADPAGSASYNVRLSKKRADAVKAYLEGKGLPATNIRSVGYGETRLVVPGAWKDKAGADQNRRVTFVIETGNAAAIIAAMRDSSGG